jgi:pentatricopeptide repeat protein
LLDEYRLDEEEDEEEQEESKEESKDKQENLREQLDVIADGSANFYMANRFYYEVRDYEEAIKMYKAVIDEEPIEAADEEPDEELEALIKAKSLYYMAESYVKLDQFDEAISVFEDLIEELPEHYLASSARRRINALKEYMIDFD